MAKVLISEKMNPVAEEVLCSAGHEVIWMPSIEQSVFEEYIKDCDALLNRILPVTRERMESNPKLKIISKHGVGAFSEIYDGDPPHEPHGTISSALSTAALLSVSAMLEKNKEA